MPTDNPATTAAPTPIDLTEVVITAARYVDCDLDTDELVVATALHPDLVLQLVHAAVRLATHRYAQALLATATESLQYVAVDENGMPVHEDELAYLKATLATVDHAGPLLSVAVAHACRRLHATGLGLVWPVDTDEPDPPAPPAPDEPASPAPDHPAPPAP